MAYSFSLNLKISNKFTSGSMADGARSLWNKTHYQRKENWIRLGRIYRITLNKDGIQ
jgi:hypothetical protein